MDISNIYFKKRKCFEIFAHKAELKLVDLEINKGINDGYLMALHGSVVELHVGGADQQELGQQGLSMELNATQDSGNFCRSRAQVS